MSELDKESESGISEFNRIYNIKQHGSTLPTVKMEIKDDFEFLKDLNIRSYESTTTDAKSPSESNDLASAAVSGGGSGGGGGDDWLDDLLN